MAGSSYGTIFRITTWGESHGAGVGVVIDGCPGRSPPVRRRYSEIFKQTQTGTE